MIMNKEAIEVLKIKRECFDFEGFSCKMPYLGAEIGCNTCAEAVDMAIEALENQDKIKTIMLTKGGEYKCRALMDCQRQLIYDRCISAEMASALGWNWSDEE